MNPRRVSVEPSRRCSKACSFCYNGSGPEGEGEWTATELVEFGRDLAAHGVEALSIGGGEPLEWDGIFDALRGLEGALLRSLTTNGLPLLEAEVFDRLVAARPDKVHISVHNPRSRRELQRVSEQAHALASRGVQSGINLVVARPSLDEARAAARLLRQSGIGNDRIVYLPMRGADTPTPEELASVTGGPFQSMTCLRGCAKSERFVSIAADRTVAWCSYTRSRRALDALTHAALLRALEDLPLAPCDEGALVRLDLSRRPTAPRR